MTLTAAIVMQLIDGYAENRHKLGAPEYNKTTALSRSCVEAAIETIVGAAAPPLLFDVKKGLRSTAGDLGPAEERFCRVTDPLLMQDENSGRDGRRYNEWFASRPDARLRAREAAEAIKAERIAGQEKKE